MIELEFVGVMRAVSNQLRAQGVAHCVGGSISSSRHGMVRSTLDIDFVADLSPEAARVLVRALTPAFYADEETAVAAAREERSFNLIDSTTVIKVDIFVAGRDPIARSSLAHAAPDMHGVPIASAVDTLVAKLRWFRLGGETSERQWRDVIGLLRAGIDSSERPRLERLATTADVLDLLERADAEA